MFSIDAHKLNVYRLISGFFKDAYLTKCYDMTIRGTPYSFYYGKVESMLCEDKNYIIAITRKDQFKEGFVAALSTLQWISFQTRTIHQPPRYDIRSNQVDFTITEGIKSPIQLEHKYTDKTTYTCARFPQITIELMHTDKHDSYSSSGTLQSALETYNCNVSFLI